MSCELPPDYYKLKGELMEALDALFLGNHTFSAVYAQTPEQAVAALKEKPDVFGNLRAYVGPTKLEANKQRVLRLARLLYAIQCEFAPSQDWIV